MIKNRWVLLILLMGFLLLGTGGEKKADKDTLLVADETEESEESEDRFEISSEKTTVELSEGKERTVLSGNAVVLSGATEIRADKIELFGKDFNFAVCTGNVSARNNSKGIYLRCEEMFYDRKKKLIRIEGFAEMLDKENNMTVKGNFLQDDSESEVTLIQIGVRIIKEDIVCRAESAKYDRKTKILELTGKPLVIKDGDEYRATRIVLNVETDEISLEGDVTARMIQEEEEEEEE